LERENDGRSLGQMPALLEPAEAKMVATKAGIAQSAKVFIETEDVGGAPAG